MSSVRSAAVGVSEVRNLPHLFPEAGGSGIDSWRAEGELVSSGRWRECGREQMSWPRSGSAMDLFKGPVRGVRA